MGSSYAILDTEAPARGAGVARQHEHDTAAMFFSSITTVPIPARAK